MIEAGLKWGLVLSVCAALTGCIEAGEFQETVEADAQTSDAAIATDGSTDGTAPTDASGADAEPTDAGTTDAEPADAGTTDTGATDAGATDAGATDAGATDSGTEDVASNQPPDFTELMETPSTTEGVELSYGLEATDPEDDSLTWTLLDGPPDLTIDSATGTLTWTPGYNLVTIIGGSAQYSVEFTIADEASPPNIVTVEIQITVYGDADEDGTMDDEDPCKEVANESSFDLDNDALPDDCDDDIDGDGVDNNEDVCVDTVDPEQEDIDQDGLGDACDSDMDGDDILNDEDDDVDGDDVLNDADNCPETPNPGDEDGDQDDLDEDGTGDACDSDLDGDGLNNDVDGDLDDDEVLNDEDNCPWEWNQGQDDWDEDGEGDECDDDIDGDGLSNDDDWCPEDDTGNEDTDGDDVADCYDEDDDDDGYNDEDDPCPLDVSDDDDLNYDVLNCGACGDPCNDSNGANVASWACDDGQCVIDACDDGYVEMQGCQEQPVIYVDAWNLGDSEEDGSEAHPFVDLQTAIDNSGDGYAVQIMEGAYQGPITIGLNNLTLSGLAENLVKINGDDENPVIDVSGDGVVIENITTSGGSMGVTFSGGELSPLTGGVITSVAITNVVGKGGGESDLVLGLGAKHVASLHVENVTIDGVTHDGPVGVPSSDSALNFEGERKAIGVRLAHVDGAQITGLSIANIIGQDGASVGSCCSYYNGQMGTEVIGIDLLESWSVTMVDTQISAVEAGGGGTATQYGGFGGPGQTGTGLRIMNSQETSIENLMISGVTGGHGAPGAYKGGPNIGAPGYGIVIQGSVTTSLEGFSVEEVSGGGGAHQNATNGIGIQLHEESEDTSLTHGLIAEISPSACSVDQGAGAVAVGLLLANVSKTSLEGLIFRDLHGSIACPWTGSSPTAAAIWLADAKLTSMSHLTLHAIGPNSHGILAESMQVDPVLITNSIFSEISGAPVVGDTPQASALLSMSSSIVHECSEPIANDVSLGSGILEKNPSFVDADEGDLHLKASSPAIDAGKSGSDFCNEPEPNGGAANLGAYGNTDEANSKIGSSHVPCDD